MNYAPTPRFFELLLRIFPQIIDYSVYFFSRKETALRINWIPPDLLYRIKKNRNLLKTIIYRTIHEIMWKIKLLKKVIINEFLRSTNIFRRFSLRHFSRLKKEKKKRERERKKKVPSKKTLKINRLVREISSERASNGIHWMKQM